MVPNSLGAGAAKVILLVSAAIDGVVAIKNSLLKTGFTISGANHIGVCFYIAIQKK